MKKILFFLLFFNFLYSDDFSKYYCPFECDNASDNLFVVYVATRANSDYPKNVCELYNGEHAYFEDKGGDTRDIYYTRCTSDKICEDENETWSNDLQICIVDEPTCNEPDTPIPDCPDGSTCDTKWVNISDTNLSCSSTDYDVSFQSYKNTCINYARCVFTPKADDNSTSQDSDNDGSSEDSTNDGANNNGFCTINKKECESCNCPLGTHNAGAVIYNKDGSFNYLTCANGNIPIFCTASTKENPAGDCAIGYVPAPDYDVTGHCVPENSDNICDYPIPLYNDVPFQQLVSDIFICRDLQRRYSTGINETFSCPDGSVACYYERKSNSNDNNNSNNDNEGSTVDNNESVSDDSNTSNDLNLTIDTTNIENKLDAINNSLSSKGSISKGLSALTHLTGQASQTNHNDLQNLNGTLTNGLNNVNDNLKDIKDNMIGKDTELSFDNSALNSKLSEAKTVFNNALVSFETSYNDIKTLFNSAKAPTISASGECFLSGTTKNIGDFKFDFSVLDKLRLPFLFILNLFLLFFTIKLYTRIARDLMSYMIGA